MAETHSTCTRSLDRRSTDQAERAAGARIAELMASLTDVDRDAIRATVSRVLVALEPFTPVGRQRVLDYAAAEREVTP